jgi:hypothetical protein
MEGPPLIVGLALYWAMKAHPFRGDPLVLVAVQRQRSLKSVAALLEITEPTLEVFPSTDRV